MVLPTSIRNPMVSFHLEHINSSLNKQIRTLNSSCRLSPQISAPKFTASKVTKYPFLFISTSKSCYLRLNHPDNAAESALNCSVRHDTSNSQITEEGKKAEKKSFWAAVSLIIGTAIGPGMLGLPSATIKSGSLPSTVAILLSWVYVISSIILVAELSFAAMDEDGFKEVSFTGLATKAFGVHFGAFVSLVYVSLSFSLLVACVSGIGSVVSQWFPNLNNVASHALFPLSLGCIIWFFPFKAIDWTNRFLCFTMVVSIITLVGIGVSVARANLLVSLSKASWNIFSILPAIPVTVLTLGFHVITPFICKIAGDSIQEARKAILIGGIVPLIMVLSWNLIVLGLAGIGKTDSSSFQVIVASFYPSTFSRALDFAGVYANCFLFGILPPAMAFIHKSNKTKLRSSLPGGDMSLFLLFSIAVILSIWH